MNPGLAFATRRGHPERPGRGFHSGASAGEAVRRRQKSKPKPIPFHHIISQFDVAVDPLLILLPFMRWLNSEEKDRLNIRNVCAALVEGHEIDREKWLGIIRQGCQCSVDLIGTPIVEITSDGALKALCLLVIEGNPEWRKRFRKCKLPECALFFLVQRGQLRDYCIKRHGDAHRQAQYRERDPERFRRRQKDHFYKSVTEYRPWTKK